MRNSSGKSIRMNFVSMPLTWYSAWSSFSGISVAIGLIVANRVPAAQFDPADAGARKQLDSMQGG
jgi:hypothetical protein